MGLSSGMEFKDNELLNLAGYGNKIFVSFVVFSVFMLILLALSISLQITFNKVLSGIVKLLIYHMFLVRLLSYDSDGQLIYECLCIEIWKL